MKLQREDGRGQGSLGGRIYEWVLEERNESAAVGAGARRSAGDNRWLALPAPQQSDRSLPDKLQQELFEKIDVPGCTGSIISFHQPQSSMPLNAASDSESPDTPRSWITSCSVADRISWEEWEPFQPASSGANVERAIYACY